MSEPTQLVISEQAREAAKQALHIVTICGARNSYVIHDRIAEHFQLLLNSQREAIIRECAEEARKCKNENATTEYAKGTLNGHIWARHNIFAKLQNK